MEMCNAEIETRDENKYLKLVLKDASFEIPITEDEPKKVKAVFNELVKRLKKGVFNFQFREEGGDLYSQISKEYLTQLNTELVAVHGELKHYNLLEVSKS